jgi:hypothetical protein
MSLTTVPLACVALLILDSVARTWRTQLVLKGRRHPLSFREVLVQSGIGETASSLTLLRAGGEPPRSWVMVRQGVPVRVAVVSADRSHDRYRPVDAPLSRDRPAGAP